ncbi:hypothetical protein KDL29_12275 [bacterium]|nr:hypothetical protein [bacterium]
MMIAIMLAGCRDSHGKFADYTPHDPSPSIWEKARNGSGPQHYFSGRFHDAYALRWESKLNNWGDYNLYRRYNRISDVAVNSDGVSFIAWTSLLAEPEPGQALDPRQLELLQEKGPSEMLLESSHGALDLAPKSTVLVALDTAGQVAWARQYAGALAGGPLLLEDGTVVLATSSDNATDFVEGKSSRRDPREFQGWVWFVSPLGELQASYEPGRWICSGPELQDNSKLRLELGKQESEEGVDYVDADSEAIIDSTGSLISEEPLGLERMIIEQDGIEISVHQLGPDDPSHGQYASRELVGSRNAAIIWKESLPAAPLDSLFNPVNGQVIFQHTPDFSSQMSANGAIDWLSFNDGIRTWSKRPEGQVIWDRRIGFINVLEDAAIMESGDLVLPITNMEAISGGHGAARQVIEIARLDGKGEVLFSEPLPFTNDTTALALSGGTIFVDSTDTVCVVYHANSRGIFSICRMDGNGKVLSHDSVPGWIGSMPAIMDNGDLLVNTGGKLLCLGAPGPDSP